MIRTTNDTIRTLLLQAHLPAHFWAEALHTSTYLLNRLPSTVCPAPTPHQALFGPPPRYDHLRVFGCACYPNTATTAPHKLAPRSTLCVFLGYSPDHKGYRCFDLSSRRLIISRHVVFDESAFPYSSTTTPPSSDPDLDLFTLFSTDALVEPPILPLSAGPCSPPVGPTPGPVPCPGPVVSPYGGVASPRRPVSDRPRAERGWWDCTAYGAVGTNPSSSLCPADAGLPAPTTVAGVRPSTAAATCVTCRTAGVPPTAPSPQPVARPPDGDATCRWYPAAPSPGGHDRRLTGFSGTLLRLHRPAGPPLASGDGGGVCGARRQPDMGSGAPSARHQRRHRQVDPDTQAAGRWYPGAVQGSLGPSVLHSAPRSRLR
jgi:hypothetical protein